MALPTDMMRLFPTLVMAALLLAGGACQSAPAYCPTDDLRPVIADLGELSTAALRGARLLVFNHPDWQWEMQTVLAEMELIVGRTDAYPDLSDAIERVASEYRAGMASGDVGHFAAAASLLAATSPPEC